MMPDNHRGLKGSAAAEPRPEGDVAVDAHIEAAQSVSSLHQ